MNRILQVRFHDFVFACLLDYRACRVPLNKKTTPVRRREPSVYGPTLKRGKKSFDDFDDFCGFALTEERKQILYKSENFFYHDCILLCFDAQGISPYTLTITQNLCQCKEHFSENDRKVTKFRQKSAVRRGNTRRRRRYRPKRRQRLRQRCDR